MVQAAGAVLERWAGRVDSLPELLLLCGISAGMGVLCFEVLVRLLPRRKP